MAERLFVQAGLALALGLTVSACATSGPPLVNGTPPMPGETWRCRIMAGETLAASGPDIVAIVLPQCRSVASTQPGSHTDASEEGPVEADDTVIAELAWSRASSRIVAWAGEDAPPAAPKARRGVIYRLHVAAIKARDGSVLADLSVTQWHRRPARGEAEGALAIALAQALASAAPAGQPAPCSEPEHCRVQEKRAQLPCDPNPHAGLRPDCPE